MSKSRMCVSGA